MLSDSDSTVILWGFHFVPMEGGSLNIAYNHDPCFVLFFGGAGGVSTFSSQHHHHHQDANYVILFG